MSKLSQKNLDSALALIGFFANKNAKDEMQKLIDLVAKYEASKKTADAAWQAVEEARKLIAAKAEELSKNTVTLDDAKKLLEAREATFAASIESEKAALAESQAELEKAQEDYRNYIKGENDALEVKRFKLGEDISSFATYQKSKNDALTEREAALDKKEALLHALKETLQTKQATLDSKLSMFQEIIAR